ncbi:hypothetical protein LCGC14_1103930 [marine sediment metagenome]|uniref:Uncharacterized protein n=1 Tax=marine sediment metagenome TaxID=412755 RepID=A0A0F9M8S9_9ZZZZ
MIALRTGLTAEAETDMEDDSWVGGVRLCGQDNAGHALALRLDTDELAELTVIAENGLAAFLRQRRVPGV